MQIKKAQFAFTSYDGDVSQALDRPQIALAGRSNVGKSSLINHICNHSRLARISSTPGKTRAVHFYLINEAFYLVDLPGYGYANVSKQEKERWGGMMQRYFETAHTLRLVLMLLDLRHDPSADDRHMAGYVEHNQLPYRLIGTKADKVHKSKRRAQAQTLSDRLGMTFRSEAIVYSSTQRLGVAELLAALDDALK